MSFWDSVKKLTKPYSEDDYDYEEENEEFEEEAEEEIQEAAPRSRRTSPFASAGESVGSAFGSTASNSFGGQVVNMSSGKQEVVLFHAKSFDDAAKATEELRNRRAIILNMENVDKALTRRVVDFLSGSIFALDGKVKKIAQSTYLFCPYSMDIVGDLETFQAEAESYI